MADHVQSRVHSNDAENGASPADMSTQPTQDEKRLEIPAPSLLQSIFSWRAFMALHMNLAVVLFIMLQINISMALVCMLKFPVNGNASLVGENMTSRHVTSQLNETGMAPGETGGRGECRNGSHLTDVDGTEFSADMSRGEFEWESSTQGLILTSANILGFLMPLLADFLMRKMGAKLLLTLSMASSAILTLLHPVGARMSVYVLVAMRMGIGFFWGVTFPVATEIFSWWAPDKEKVSMMSFAFSGMSMGNVVTSITSGYLCSIDIDNGWPFIFYVQGALPLAWCVLWQFTGSDRPEDHPFISEDEKLYILRTRTGMTTDKNQKRTSPPYRTILTSVPVWSFVGVMASHHFTAITLFSYLPLFFTRVFGINVQDVGLITSVGYVVRFVGAIMWGQLSNVLLNKTRLGKTACRKLIQCGGFYMNTAIVIVLGYITDKIPSAITVFVIMYMHSVTMSSGIVNPLDIAPRFSGFLSGLFTAISSLVAFPGPVIAGILTEEGTLEAWRNLFIVMAVVFFSGATCFLVLGSTTLQTWGTPEESIGVKEKQDPMNDSELMETKTTVCSMGQPPVSPTKETRFDFTVKYSSMKIDAASVEYSINSADIQTKTNGYLQVCSNLSEGKESNKSTERNDPDKNRPRTASHHTRPDKVSYTNPGFESDSEIARHSTTEQGSNKLQATESKNGNTLSNSKGEDQRSRSCVDLKRKPGLKVNVKQSVPVSFSGEELMGENKARIVEEVETRASGDQNIVEQTRL